MNALIDRLSLLGALTKSIQDEGFEYPIARLMARRLFSHIQKANAGCFLYVGTRDPDEGAARRAAIRRDYDGTSACRERLQRRWGISKATFFRIIKAD